MLYLILHKVRGEPAFDIAQQLEGTDIWIVPTSGHRCYPYKKWALEDLFDGSDINYNGFHDAPWTHDTVPEDWPDHYQMAKPLRLVTPDVTIEDLLI